MFVILSEAKDPCIGPALALFSVERRKQFGTPSTPTSDILPLETFRGRNRFSRNQARSRQEDRSRRTPAPGHRTRRRHHAGHRRRWHRGRQRFSFSAWPTSFAKVTPVPTKSLPSPTPTIPPPRCWRAFARNCATRTSTAFRPAPFMRGVMDCFGFAALVSTRSMIKISGSFYAAVSATFASSISSVPPTSDNSSTACSNSCAAATTNWSVPPTTRAMSSA